MSFSHTFDIPAQAATGADTLFIGQSTTFWGTQFGVNILSHGGIKAGVNGFYSASADANIVGGSVFLKIPFSYDTAFAGESGITEAKK